MVGNNNKVDGEKIMRKNRGMVGIGKGMEITVNG